MRKCTALSTITASWIPRVSLFLLVTACLSYSSPLRAQSVKIIKATPVRDRVTLDIKVKGEEGRPVVNLKRKDFTIYVDDNPVSFNREDWRSAKDNKTDPAWIVFLLDMSGSMKEKDGSDIRKLDGAIQAIQDFITATEQRNQNTKIAVIPFGEVNEDQGGTCKGYPVNNTTIDKSKFYSPGNPQLTTHLTNLKAETPCASTNLYAPLIKAVEFLSDEEDPEFYPPKEKKNQRSPRLSVILLSDGYHNSTKPRKEEGFEELQELLRDNERIVVHSLGYGLTPEELGNKYNLGRPAKLTDVNRGVPSEEFLDTEELDKIAGITEGICEISADSKEVTKALQHFLNDILGEYQITYTEPNPERASQHTVQVEINSNHINTGRSDGKSYTIAAFGRTLPGTTRLLLFVSSIIGLGVGGVIPFWLWSQKLEK